MPPPSPSPHLPSYPLPPAPVQDQSNELSPPPIPTTTLPTRLNIHPLARLAIANVFAFTSIFLSTALRTTHTSSLQFRAENAHRLPKTQKGWYFYHRSRNYHAGHNAVVNGFKKSLGMCGYVSLFVLVENGVDVTRGSVDFGSTVFSGGVTGGVFGLVRKLPLSTTALTAKKGLWYGFLYGITQDIMLAARGESVFWIDPFTGRNREAARKWRRRRKQEDEERKGSLQESEK
ncbi:hypothetical protein ABW20_dc0102369 [Dactylellina cionopaga]|nr:hypothetical protein ABW20_dc0102369 [Dactylellina cionopaga]